MEQTLLWAKTQAVEWLGAHGYGAVVPALLLDPGGIPWPWIFLMLLAEEAGKSVTLMILFGCIVLSAVDHALFFLGKFGRPWLRKTGERWPQVAQILDSSETAIRKHGFWAICAGRFLPFVGRWVGLGSGLAGVSWSRFALFDAIGVLVTVAGFGILAHFVGRKTLEDPRLQGWLFASMIAGVVFALGAMVWQFWRMKRNKSTAETASD